MRLLFKQRLFSWFDSYDIYTEDGSVCYTVKGQLAWGHLLKVYDAQGHEDNAQGIEDGDEPHRANTDLMASASLAMVKTIN